MDRESPNQSNQTEEGTMQTEINCDTLTAIICQIQKLYVTVPLLLYFLCIWGQFPSTSPRGLIQLVRERLSEKMWTRQSRKVICDMINTLFLTLLLSNLVLFLSFSTRKHTSMASRAILSNFFEEQWTQNHPQYLSALSRALFPTTFLEIAVFMQRDNLTEGFRVTSLGGVYLEGLIFGILL